MVNVLPDVDSLSKKKLDCWIIITHYTSACSVVALLLRLRQINPKQSHIELRSLKMCTIEDESIYLLYDNW